jgi:hypothetical protein
LRGGLLNEQLRTTKAAGQLIEPLATPICHPNNICWKPVPPVYRRLRYREKSHEAGFLRAGSWVATSWPEMTLGKCGLKLGFQRVCAPKQT